MLYPQHVNLMWKRHYRIESGQHDVPKIACPWSNPRKKDQKYGEVDQTAAFK